MWLLTMVSVHKPRSVVYLKQFTVLPQVLIGELESQSINKNTGQYNAVNFHVQREKHRSCPFLSIICLFMLVKSTLFRTII